MRSVSQSDSWFNGHTVAEVQRARRFSPVLALNPGIQCFANGLQDLSSTSLSSPARKFPAAQTCHKIALRRLRQVKIALRRLQVGKNRRLPQRLRASHGPRTVVKQNGRRGCDGSPVGAGPLTVGPAVRPAGEHTKSPDLRAQFRGFMQSSVAFLRNFRASVVSCDKLYEKIHMSE